MNLENLENETVEETTPVEQTETNEEELNLEIQEEGESENNQEQVEETEEDVFEKELQALKEYKKHNFENAKARLEKKGTKDEDIEDRIVSKLRGELLANAHTEALEEELSKIDSPKKRELVKYHYENSIQKSGMSRQSVRDDMQKALAIVNATALLKRSNEEKEARIAKKTVGKGISSGSQAPVSNKKEWEKVLTPSELAFGKARKWTEDMFKKAAELKRTNKQ